MPVRRLARISLMVTATAALSFVRIPLPFSPVPITGQTLGTMLAGLLLGAADGGLSQLVYVLLGVAGLPLFGGMAGPGVLMGPTGGYLVGMIAGAWITGRIAGSTTRSARMAGACVLGGVLAVYVPGILWLAAVTGLDLAAAATIGALPYLPGDAIKVVAALLIAGRLAFLRSPQRGR